MIKRLLVLGMVLQCVAVRADDWMKFPAYERTVLPNGATLLLMERHGAPLIDVSLALRTGSTQDPTGQEGLAEMTNELLRKGAGARTAAEIAEELDFIGAHLETSTTLEITRVQLDFLAKDSSKALDIFADLIVHPKFPTNEVEKILKQQVDEIRAAKDQPLEVLPEYYKQSLFGTHPYGRSPEGDETSLPALTRAEILNFHESTYVASNMVFVAVGDFKISEMRDLLSARFGSLPAKGRELKKVAEPTPATAPRVLLVDKPDATQTFFALGSVGISVHDPDRLTAQLVNTLFGGRFTSRLNTALRIDSGLSYGAHSSFGPLRYPGDFTIFSFTKNESTGEALDAALKVLADLHQNGLTQAELDSGKAYLQGQFGPTIETPAQLSARLALFEIYGLDPKEEVDRYAARLEAVTLADAKRVIEKAFPGTNLVFAIIGKGETIGTVVKKYAAEARTIPISEPGYGR